jgi:hypothetical protein
MRRRNHIPGIRRQQDGQTVSRQNRAHPSDLPRISRIRRPEAAWGTGATGAGSVEIDNRRPMHLRQPYRLSRQSRRHRYAASILSHRRGHITDMAT